MNGEFSVRKYTDKDGNEKQSTEVRVQDFQLLGQRPEGAGGQAQAPAQTQAPRQPTLASLDDDIPF